MNATVFKAYDDLIFSLYSAGNFNDLKQQLFGRIQDLIPYRFASLRLAGSACTEKEAGGADVFCDPESYRSAEKQYMEHLQWETPKSMVLIRKRNGNTEYESMQLQLEWMGQFLGTLTLFRTAGAGSFTEEESQLLQTLGRYLHVAVHRHMHEQPICRSLDQVIENISVRVHLTPREKEILGLLYRTQSNPDICDHLCITEHTLQKHLQNLYRKLNISSRWELVQYLMAG